MDTKRTRKIVREVVPPALYRTLGVLKSLRGGRFRFTGPYETWEEAVRHSSGYNTATILEKVRNASRKVRAGEGVFERDSVVFHKHDYPYPLLAVLLRSAMAHYGHLSVLDFGGSLGSVYYQCRGFLADLRRIRWSIVEQPAFVECGRDEFQTDELRFFESIEECLQTEVPHVALLSSVLQYLPDPATVTHQITGGRPAYIIVDRTPVHDSAGDKIVVQHVPASIYKASYPCRIFTRENILRFFGPHYSLAAEFPAVPFDALERSLGARYEGFVFHHAPDLQTSGKP